MPDSDRPTKAPPPGDEAPERTTRVTCFECGGHYATEQRSSEPGRFSYAMCRWCTAGTMDREQALRWSRAQRKR